MITNQQADILQHTSNTGRYVCDHNATMAELVSLNLLHDYGAQHLAAGDHYYVTTVKGRAALNEWQAAQPKPPKVKKRRRTEAFNQWRIHREYAYPRLTFPEFLQRRKEYQS